MVVHGALVGLSELWPLLDLAILAFDPQVHSKRSWAAIFSQQGLTDDVLYIVGREAETFCAVQGLLTVDFAWQLLPLRMSFN